MIRESAIQAEKVTTADALEAIREELARLSERVAALEEALPRQPAARAAEPPAGKARVAQPPPQAIDDEILTVIAAAVAAFLGKKPHIRQIRLIGATGWAQQGRVTMQASHALAAQHTRS